MLLVLFGGVEGSEEDGGGVWMVAEGVRGGFDGEMRLEIQWWDLDLSCEVCFFFSSERARVYGAGWRLSCISHSLLWFLTIKSQVFLNSNCNTVYLTCEASPAQLASRPWISI